MTDHPTCPLEHRHDPERPRRASAGHLCTGHYLGLADDLASLPRIHAILEAYLVRTGSSDGPGQRDAVGISLDAEVVAARDHIRNLLTSWARVALEEGPWVHPPRDDLESVSAWLLGRLGWLLAQPWADELAANAATTAREARASIQPNTTYRVELGPCPVEILTLDDDTGAVTSSPCDGTVIAVMRKAASREQLPSEVRCTSHGDDDEAPHVWGPMQWHALGRRMGRSLDASAADAFLRAVGGAP